MIDINLDFFKELRACVKDLYAEIQKSAPAAKRKMMCEALYQSTDLIEDVLSYVKIELNRIRGLILYKKDYAEADMALNDLSALPEWERKLKAFQYCQALRDMGLSLSGKELGFFSIGSWANGLEARAQKVELFLMGEVTAGKSISDMLSSLSLYAGRTQSEPDRVVAELTKAMNQLDEVREGFFEAKVEIRKAIG